jgi:hypothetical protein
VVLHAEAGIRPQQQEIAADEGGQEFRTRWSEARAVKRTPLPELHFLDMWLILDATCRDFWMLPALSRYIEHLAGPYSPVGSLTLLGIAGTNRWLREPR